MGDGKHGDWMDVDYLHQLNGSSSDASPVLAIFLAHRVAASGRLWMTHGVNIRSIDFLGGKISGCSGFTELFEGSDGERGWSLDEWAKSRVDDGLSQADALQSVGVALCAQAISVEDSGDWMVNFVPSKNEGDGSDIDAIGALLQAIEESVSDDDVRRWLEGVASTGVEAWMPDGVNTENWPYSDGMKRLFEAASRNSSVGSLFVVVGGDGWSELGKLWRLGMIRPKIEALRSAPPPEAAVKSKPTSEQSIAESGNTKTTRPNRADSTDRTVKSKPEAQGLDPEKGSRRSTKEKADRKASSGRRRDDTTKPRKKRRRDPRLVAIMRAPYENPEMMEEHLREAYGLLSRMRPEVIFRIKKSDDLDATKIERRYLDACSRYHPDRYRGADQGVQSLAEGCFTAVSDAFHRLKDEAYLSDLRVRLVEKETGKRVVTDKTRASAKVEFAKADVLYKQKRYDAAYDLASQAAEGDPDRWQYEFLKLRAGYRTGAIGVDEVRNIVGGMSGMNSMEKGNALYTVGEMYMREGQDKKAFELFRQTLTLDDQNVGARRRLRLKDRRQQEANEQEKPGLFGGLFQRRKR